MDRPLRTPVQSPAAWVCLAVPLVIGLTADLVTKHYAFKSLVSAWLTDEAGRTQVESDPYPLIPNYLHLQAHLNYGAVFGIGQGARALFIFVSALAIMLLIHLFRRSGGQRLYQVLLGMLLAGVLGNLYDRALYGYVRDMIYAFPNWRWTDIWSALPSSDVFPWIFNIADSLLCTGVGGMFIYTMLRRDDPTEAPVDPARQKKVLADVDER
jgi:signal peptidase II